VRLVLSEKLSSTRGAIYNMCDISLLSLSVIAIEHISNNICDICLYHLRSPAEFVSMLAGSTG